MMSDGAFDQNWTTSEYESPLKPNTAVNKIIEWVKAEHARHQLPLPPHGNGTRADVSLADALVLVEEIERLTALAERGLDDR